MVAGLRDARENIDDDEFAGAQRAGAAVVRIARLIAAGDDGVGGDAAGLEDRDLDGKFEDLARDEFAAVEKFAAGDFAGAENFFGGGEAQRAAPVAFANGGGLGGCLDLALGKECAFRHFEIEAEFEEFFVNARGEIGGHGETRLPKIFRHEGDDLRRADLALRPEFAGALEKILQREDDVEVGGAFDATEFERADDGVFFAAQAEAHERVGHLDPAEVERVGAMFGGGVEEERGGGFLFCHRQEGWKRGRPAGGD